MGFLAALGVVTSVVGAIDGYRGAKKAERQQRQQVGIANAGFDESFDLLEQGREEAAPFWSELLDLARSQEEDQLSQVDPVIAAEIQRIRDREEQATARDNQELRRRGLDSFTTRTGVQRGNRADANRGILEANARGAGLRSTAIAQGRGAAINALQNRAAFEFGSRQSQAQVRAQQAGFNGGVQILGPNNAAGIGQLAGGFADLYRTSVLEKALEDSGPKKDE